MKGLRAVAFDFYGTLAVQHPDEANVDRAILAGHGCEVDDALLMRWIDPVTSLDHTAASVDSVAYSRFCSSLWRDLLLGAGVAADRVEGVIHEAVERGMSRRLVPFDDAVASLRALRAAGLRLAICSNWGWDLAAVVRSSGLPDWFDVVLSSAEAGYRKPHPRIFEILVERLGVEAGSVLFVGDTVHADVQGAEAAGLPAVELAATNGEPARPGVVSSLSELVDLVVGAGESSTPLGLRRRETA